MQTYYKAVQFQIGLSGGTPEQWEPSNDYSFQELTTSFAISDYIPVYEGDTLVWGSGPGEEPATPTPSPTPVQSTPTPGLTNPGDLNNDGTIDIIDALLVAQYYVGLNPQNFNPENADTNCDGSIDIVDALVIAQYYVGLRTEFC